MSKAKKAKKAKKAEWQQLVRTAALGAAEGKRVTVLSSYGHWTGTLLRRSGVWSVWVGKGDNTAVTHFITADVDKIGWSEGAPVITLK